MENILILVIVAVVLLTALLFCYSAYRKLKSDNWVLRRKQEEHLKIIKELRNK